MPKATIKRDRDLKGATPETLARALLRPGQRRKPVVSDKVSVEKVATNKSGNSKTHLKKGV